MLSHLNSAIRRFIVYSAAHSKKPLASQVGVVGSLALIVGFEKNNDNIIVLKNLLKL